MKRLQLLILCFWILSFPAIANDFMFKHLEVKDRFSNNQVNAIYKDSKGFLWVGTASGLNRYDGYDVKPYYSRKDDGTSLPDSYIQDIQEDKSGRLWVRTGLGYALYNPDSDNFDSNMEAYLRRIGISGSLALVYIDQEGAYWMYVYDQGVYRYQAGQERALLVKGSAELVSVAEVSAMNECGEGLLLVLNNGLLACIDKEEDELKWTNRDIVTDGKEIIKNGFELFIDRSERAWIFGVEGAWIYNLARKEWEQRSPRTDVYNTVRAVAQDKYGRIWVGRDQDGIEVIEPTGRKIVLSKNSNNGRALPDNTITTLYEDKGGTMWVGTYKKGISFYHESAFKFGIAEVGDVNCVEDGEDGIVWLGTNDRGLVRWNSVTDERTLFSHTAHPHSISSDVIVCLLRDSGGKIWAGTYWGGLNCYDGSRFVHYRAGAEEGNSLALDNVWALAEDADRNIWIGTLGGGLQCLNPRTGLFTTYTTGNSDLVSNYVSSLCIGRGGYLVIGTSEGMSLMDLKTRKMTAFGGVEAAEERRLVNQSVNQVYEDSRGLLWVATREGLNVYDAKHDRLYEVSVKPDGSKQMILGLAEDADKNMWASVGGELVNVLLSTDGKTGELSFRCYAYNDKDGLQSCDFNQRSLKCLRSGEIVAGGLYGLNRFRPDNIKHNRMLPRVMFTDFLLFNEGVKVGQAYDGNVVLKEALNETEEVVLEYRQNVFTVLFASDNFVLPEKTQYHYKLEGFNDDWLTNPAGMHRVTYTNLAPGTYRLKVKATNSDGYVGTEEACLKIVILPPFWMTAWAYALYALAVVGMVVLALYSVQRRERNRFRMRQMEEDAKKKEELNQLKFRFFTNVSHELRTPLTLIISPMEKMMREVTDENLHGKLELMYRNAQRLLNLVNQLLDFRKLEMAGMHLTLSEGDIVAYVRGICNSFLMLSEKRHVHLTFFSTMESLDMSFDEDKIGKVVMNLLSNAFKFTPEGGRVDVAVEMSKELPGKLLIKVADTGVGIKDEDKVRIFDRFYQVDYDDSHHQSTGSGIGLSLVHDFVTLHEGTVRVMDNVDSGSVFVVELPVKQVGGVAKSASLSEKEEEAEGVLPDMDEEETLQELLPDEEQEANAEEQEKPLALIVDDNEDLIAFMRDSLSLYFRIRSASNGREAWQKIPELMPDIIVSDVMMPEMDGNELCRWVKTDKRTSDIPMILLTARQTVEDKVEGLTIGADDYVTKPFNVEILILRMRKLIDLSKKSRMVNKAKARIDPEPSQIAITSLDEKLVENAIKYVEANISRCDLSVEELSRELGMSRVHLYKKLSQITGKTPIEFIRIIRLKRAAQLLRESQQNVSEIAYQLGFNNPKYFSKYFKDEFGVLPSVYQEREGK